jgi:hypothetical protein
MQMESLKRKLPVCSVLIGDDEEEPDVANQKPISVAPPCKMAKTAVSNNPLFQHLREESWRTGLWEEFDRPYAVNLGTAAAKYL